MKLDDLGVPLFPETSIDMPSGCLTDGISESPRFAWWPSLDPEARSRVVEWGMIWTIWLMWIRFTLRNWDNMDNMVEFTYWKKKNDNGGYAQYQTIEYGCYSIKKMCIWEIGRRFAKKTEHWERYLKEWGIMGCIINSMTFGFLQWG